MTTADTSTPSWFRWLGRQVLRVGQWRAVALLTLFVTVLSVLTTAALVALTGQGELRLAVFFASCCGLLLTPPVAAVLIRLLYELEQARQSLDVLATQDDLTGVHNRRHFMLLAEREWARCRRYDTPAALLLIDADHFKRVNDTHGHLCGDALLREITRLSGESLRQPDLLARFGGEELIVFLPHTDPLGALDVAERIRERVSVLGMPWSDGVVRTTVSIGVASLGAGHTTLDGLIHDADVALYAAKEAGRNCVRAAPIQPRRSGEQSRVASPR